MTVMNNDNPAQTPEDELTLLSSPRFDLAAAHKAHPVVPLGNVLENTTPRPRVGMLPAMWRVRPALLAVAAVLVAAAILGTATALYRQWQSSTAPASTHLSDSNIPARDLAGEEVSARNDTTPVASAKRRASPRLATPGVSSPVLVDPSNREEALGMIRGILTEQIRSHGKHEGKRKHRKEEEDDDN